MTSITTLLCQWVWINHAVLGQRRQASLEARSAHDLQVVDQPRVSCALPAREPPPAHNGVTDQDVVR